MPGRAWEFESPLSHGSDLWNGARNPSPEQDVESARADPLIDVATDASAVHRDSVYASGRMGVGAYEEAIDLVRSAGHEGVLLRLMGGLAVRALCPTFPPRERDRQDLDFASTSRARPAVTTFLVSRRCSPDEHFNKIHGHKQLFFRSPGGRSIDVAIDRLEMCHVVDFRDRIDRMPLTLDVTDLLLSKLQIVELNEKDAADVLHLLSAYPVRPGDEPGTVGLERFGDVLGNDWGWWRTVTGNLERVRSLVTDDRYQLIPPGAPLDAIEQLNLLEREAQRVPKSRRWRMRALIGERMRWYELPEEESHD